MTSGTHQLPETLEAAHAVIATLSEQLAKSNREIDLLKLKIDKLCRKLFGKSSEKVSPDQLAFAFAQLPKDEAASEEPPAEAEAPVDDVVEGNRSRRPRPTGRKAFPKHLPRKRTVVMPPAGELTCGCGQAKTQIAEKVTERLDYVPASLVVLETVRPVFVCQKCHDGVTVAPAPTQAVDQSAAGSGLLAHIIVSKYVDHLPLHRLERIFARMGVDLSRSTMCGQLDLAEEALVLLCEELLRQLRAGPYLQFDDTSVLVLTEKEKARFYGKMWTYHSPTQGLVGFDATETREHGGPLRFLEGFKGYLQGDAFSGNLTLRSKAPVFLVGCMAHLRRYFVEALEKDPRAAHFIAVIKRLYQIEEDARGLRPDERRAMRQERAKPLLRELMRLARAIEASVLPKSPLGEALTYLRNQMRYVAQYIRDGRLEIDNNGAERQLRSVAIGRKNWLFAGSMKGLRRAALLYSLVQTCKLAGVEPWAYLKDVLDRMPAHPHNRLGDLLPRQWAAARAAEQAEAAPVPLPA
ncbi:MAG: IS66 family transposase [Nocardioidaceae bacterium]